MKKQNFIHGSLILIASAAVSKVIGAIFRIPLANMLGGTGMGYFSSAYGVFMTVYAVSVTGLPVAAAKLTAECAALGKYDRMKHIKRTALIIFTLIGLVSTLLTLALSYPFCAFVSKSPEAVLAVIAIAPSILFGCVTACCRGFYEGCRNMYPTAVSQVVEALVKLAAGLALCSTVLNAPKEKLYRAAEIICRLLPFNADTFSADKLIMPLAAAAAVAGVTLSAFAGTVYVVLRDIFGGKIHTDARSVSSEDDSFKVIAKQLFAIMIPVAVGSLITNLTSLIDLATIIRSLSAAVKASPQFFERYAISADALPNFFFGSFTGLAVTVFNLIPSFTNMFGKGAVPAVAEGFAEGDTAKIKRSAMNVIFTSAFIAVPSGIGITLLAPQILELLFPTRHIENEICAVPLRVLGIGVIFLSVSSVLFSVLQAAGKGAVPVRIMLIGVAVKLAGNLLLVRIPLLNVTGAAISTVVCYGIIFILAVYEAHRCTGIKISDVLILIFKMVFCGLICGGTALLCYSILAKTVDSALILFAAIAFGGVFYIISTHLSGILTKTTLKLLIC